MPDRLPLRTRSEVRLTKAQRRVLNDAVQRGRVIAYGTDRKPIKALREAGLLEVSRYDSSLPEYRATPEGRRVASA